MRAKLSSKDLNLNYCLPYPTRTYTCGVITAPRVLSGFHNFLNLM